MSEFWVIASIGHCATKWLAEVLNSREDVTAYHELKMSSSKMAWPTAAKYESRNKAESAKYRPYFKQLQAADTPIVVDSNSWVPYLLPSVNEVMPIDKVIFIVRHGISQLYSLSEKSAVWRDSKETDFIYGEYLHFLWQDLDNKPFTFHWGDRSRWNRLCLLWKLSAWLPDWLRDQGLKVDVFTFEELTQRPDSLRELLPDATEEERYIWRKKDINRKVPGTRRPVDLWPRWKKEKQDIFTRICGPEMAQCGYEIPEVVNDTKEF